MGEVYRAHDTTLKRDVAIKTLPAEFSHDPDRLSRFQREAEVLASLNHPNIAAIYGLEEVAGNRCLILELVEGDTLADAIVTRGALPLAEALRIARQICDALEAAHDKGIVHRDLKPANVKVMPDGTVKVLDFGLAKAFDSAPVTSALSMSPTMGVTATHAGVILGTAAYMSPEQAKGRAVDRRSDIFAFGCVLYEMLTGRQTFGGEDVLRKCSGVWSLASRIGAAYRPARRTPSGVCSNARSRRTHDNVWVTRDARLDLEEGGTGIGGASRHEIPEKILAGVGRLRGCRTLALTLSVPAMTHFARRGRPKCASRSTRRSRPRRSILPCHPMAGTSCSSRPLMDRSGCGCGRSTRPTRSR